MIVPNLTLRSLAGQPDVLHLNLSRLRPFVWLSAIIIAAWFCGNVSSSAATIAQWNFDAANPTADSSGNGNTLALNGNITFSSDVAANATGTTNCAVFDGASYAQTVGTLDFTSYNQLTIEFFAKYTPNNGLQMLYAQNNPNNVVGAFYFDVSEAVGDLKMTQRSPLGFVTDLAPEPVDGAWHHYAVTMDDSSNLTFKIYVDGYQVDSTAVGQNVPFINDYFTIGAYPPSYIFNYSGEMGEMRVSSGILPPAQFLIGPQPVIISLSQQPQSRFVLTNSPATFNVTASIQGGNPTPTLAYQWQRNGVNIPGATNNSYTLASPAVADNQAQFDVVLSALSATSVTSSNAVLTVSANPTIAFWKFDAANPTADSSGNGNTLALNGNITFNSDVDANATGTTNSATFDGASYAQTVQTLNLTLYKQLTIEFFAKYTPDNGLQMFYAQNNPNNVVGAYYFDMNEPNGNLKIAQRSAAGFDVNQSPEPADGAWHHYALTMDESTNASTFKIYVDGYEVDTGAPGISVPFINDFFTVGAYPPSYTFNYAGEMGEMRISIGALTPDQFLIVASLPKIFITEQPLSTAALTNGPATFNVSANVQGSSPLPPLTYQWQRNGANINGATNSSYTLPSATLADNSAQFDVVVSASRATSITSSNAVLTVLTNNVLAYWTFDAANPSADSSGNGNTLAFNGDITFGTDAPTNNAAGITGSAIFDGASYAQTVGTLNLTLYDQLTIEFFAKFASGSPLQMFYSQNNPNNVQGAFYFDTGEAGPTALKVAQGTTGGGFKTDQAPEPTDHAWHHYALTMDESGVTPVFKIFVDGKAVDTGGLAGGIQFFINDYFTIGGYPPTYSFEYNGLLTGLRISNGLLTPAQFLTGPATLQIGFSNGNVVLNWPQNAGTFTLQQSGSLLGAWTAVTNAPTLSGLNYTISLPATGSQTFYRLSH